MGNKIKRMKIIILIIQRYKKLSKYRIDVKDLENKFYYKVKRMSESEDSC
jgi:hypothetical protein